MCTPFLNDSNIISQYHCFCYLLFAILERERNALTQKEIQLDSFSNRTSEMFNEALELLESSKKIYRALSQEKQMIYNKQLVKLNEQLLPRSRKTDDKQYSL